MKSKLINMTSGNIIKGVLMFSIPLMFSNALQILFNMADIAVVGKFAGSDALGAVGSTTFIIGIITGFLLGIGTGVNSVVAKYYGAKNLDGVKGSVHTSLLLMAIIGLLFFILCFILAAPVLSLMNTKDTFFDQAVLYLRIYMIGIPAIAVYDFGNGVWSAVGNTKKPLTYLTIAGALNLVLNLFTVIVLNMGVAGVAIASVVSQYISAILVLISLLKVDAPFKVCVKDIKLDKDRTVEILKISLPTGFQNSIYGIANLFVQAAINSFPDKMVAGNTAASNADNLCYIMLSSFYVACTSYIAQNYGAGNRERIRKSFYICLSFSFIAGLILGFLLLAFGRPFLSLFTSDSEVLDFAMKRLSIMQFSYMFSAIMDCSIAGARGFGKTTVPTIIVLLGTCAFRVAWVFTIFRIFNTIPSLYLLYPASWVLTGIAEIIYYFVLYKKKIKTLKKV